MSSPTYMALLEPTRLSIFGKSSQEHCFLYNKYQKIPTYTVIRAPEELQSSQFVLFYTDCK